MRYFLTLLIKQGLYRIYKVWQWMYRFRVDKNDFLTIEVMKRYLQKNYNCIDIGANYGYLLHYMVKIAPQGKHHAFEPITPLCNRLKKHYGKKVKVQNIALSDTNGSQTFYWYKHRPAVSGLKAREHMGGTQSEAITVQTARLDDIIPADAEKIHLVKIDVEGAELLVLKGARETLTRHKPMVLFECGKGGLDIFGHAPEDIYDLLAGCGLQVSLLEYYLMNRAPLSRDEFLGQYNKMYNYFFVAYPV
jgi:methyltransferase, FkbM family